MIRLLPTPNYVVTTPFILDLDILLLPNPYSLTDFLSAFVFYIMFFNLYTYDLKESISTMFIDDRLMIIDF